MFINFHLKYFQVKICTKNIDTKFEATRRMIGIHIHKYRIKSNAELSDIILPPNLFHTKTHVSRVSIR